MSVVFFGGNVSKISGGKFIWKVFWPILEFGKIGQLTFSTKPFLPLVPFRPGNAVVNK
jgi:hypothetical protein